MGRISTFLCVIVCILALIVARSSWIQALFLVNFLFDATLNSGYTHAMSNITVTRVSDDLPIWQVDGLVSEGEADWIREAYEPYMYSCGPRAPVGCDEVQVLYLRSVHKLLGAIEERVYRLMGNWCQIRNKCELGSFMNWQIVKYSPGGMFQRHVDGPIPLTFMAYLSDNEDGQGGSTHFPNLEVKSETEKKVMMEEREILYEILSFSGIPKGRWPPPPEGLCVRPKKGTVLMWASCLSDGDQNWQAIHEGLPIKMGNKYILNLFFNEIDMDVDVGRACREFNSNFGANDIFPQLQVQHLA
ncbi:hypothetical protein TrST_g10445 [Triparma strigata]|uniref:Prolyl 4-hydroxylase alpha subunit domain-containing protein n=1 Tax=Triparma strigata TaxID=1606541 RepID=A0A9W7C9U1_9STRA|nr:hypothetical protein TrST_g10445 [Triparma strigata]